MLRLFAIILVGLLAACGTIKSTKQRTETLEPSLAKSTKQVTEADTGRSIELYVGDKLEVTLPGNPTTGFQWEISNIDSAILRTSGEPEFEPFSSAVGSGGKITMCFEAVGTGQMKLTLIYHRPFEKDVPPARTFEVTVTVR
jgi:inhibitor of cysteine peptidase